MIKIYTSKECIATVSNTNGFTRQVFHFDDIYPEELSTLTVTCGAVTYLDDNGSVVTLGDPSCLTVQGLAPVESPVTE
jgi:predicted ATP-grasp superfamily ATP-dependent carboligase